jgi:hypothetical protein
MMNDLFPISGNPMSTAHPLSTEAKAAGDREEPGELAGASLKDRRASGGNPGLRKKLKKV